MVKHKLILISLIAFVGLWGCGRGDILSKQYVEDILFEMHLSDGVFHTLEQKGKELGSVDTVLRYKSIFEKYKCSRDKFEKSLREYARDKETLDKIYSNLQKRFEETLKDYEGKTLLEFIKSTGTQLFTPFTNDLQSIKKNFENVENFSRLIEKIMNPDENSNETNESENIKNIETNSLKQEMQSEQVLQKVIP